MGAELGFPTANIQTAPRQILPSKGVYVVESTIGKSTYSGLCSIGTRPTFDDGEITVEVHLMGFDGELYGEVLDTIFCRRLRDEMMFESADKLVEQIKKDLARIESCGR